MKDLQQYYCEVTQEEANEAEKLLVIAGEKIWEVNWAFDIIGKCNFLKHPKKDWFVGYKIGLELKTQITYPQFKEMLIEKIKGI